MIGLGLALSQPERRVLVITGDGDMLMGMGSLATIALQKPPNLSIVVLDNERYGETGMQATHTAGPVDLAAVAHSCGFEQAATLYEEEEFDHATPTILEGEGPLFFVIKIRAEDPPLVLPPRDGAHLKDRFRMALLGTDKGVNPAVAGERSDSPAWHLCQLLCGEIQPGRHRVVGVEPRPAGDARRGPHGKRL